MQNTLKDVVYEWVYEDEMKGVKTMYFSADKDILQTISFSGKLENIVCATIRLKFPINCMDMSIMQAEVAARDYKGMNSNWNFLQLTKKEILLLLSVYEKREKEAY